MRDAYRAHLNVPHVRPHGCWRIVAQALRDVHGVDLPASWGVRLADDDLAERALTIQQHLADHGTQVDTPTAGDVAVMYRFGRPVHVALYVGDGWLLQSTSDVGASHFVRVADVQYGRITYHRP